MSPRLDLWGDEAEDEPEEPSGDLLEDEPSYFPPDPEDIDQKMYRLTGELLPPADNRPLDSWPRPRNCLGCGRRGSAAFNRAANYYICFAPDCSFSGGVGVGGDNSPARMFRPQIHTAVRKILKDKRWGDWVKTLRRDIWSVACERVLNYAYGEPGGINDAGVLGSWFQDTGGDIDTVSACVYTALYGDLRDWARAEVGRRRREAQREPGWLDDTTEDEPTTGTASGVAGVANPRPTIKARPEAISNAVDVTDERYWPPRTRYHDHHVNGVGPVEGCDSCALSEMPPGMSLAQRRPLVAYAYPDGAGQCSICGGRSVGYVPDGEDWKQVPGADHPSCTVIKSLPNQPGTSMIAPK